MANIFLNIKGFKPVGVATINDPNGDAYMTVLSYSWGATRNVNMTVGNFNNRDSGIGAMDFVTFTRELDGASDALLTSVFKFANTIQDNKDFTFIFTKPKKDGKGNDIYYKVVLSGARIVGYKEVLENNKKPISEISVAFNKISVTFNTDDVVGKITNGSATIYNVNTNELEAGQFTKD